MQSEPHDCAVLRLDEVDRTKVASVGGKGALLGEVARIDGVRVPWAFCVTTAAYRRVVENDAELASAIARLDDLAPDDHLEQRTQAATVRALLLRASVPEDVERAIADAFAAFPPSTSWAVRSSATIEDLPDASYAGQHDSFLDVVGTDEVLRHVRRCWASLFGDRAVHARAHRGAGHLVVAMAVVVQRMVTARASGVLFTADPVTSDRGAVIIESCAGLGDALVAGTVTPDRHEVRDDRIVARVSAGDRAVLHDTEVLELARIGRRIEAVLGHPQDIEWCIDGDGVAVVQSRPITTLYPVPVRDDDALHVYVSVGHQQMMTDAMKPLGRSLWQMIALRPMFAAGGRLFVDVTDALAAPVMRRGLLHALGRSDPRIEDALARVVAEHPDDFPADDASPPTSAPSVPPASAAPGMLDPDPMIVTTLVEQTTASVDALRRALDAVHDVERLELIRTDIGELRRLLMDPVGMQVITTAMDAASWCNDQLFDWLGEVSVADVLTRSAPGNVTSEMGLALFDLADAIRPHPAVVALLRQRAGRPGEDGLLDDLLAVDGGHAARAAIEAYLARYGMRCVGEIDLTRPRWSEAPTSLLPPLLAAIRDAAPGEAARRFALGVQQAEAKTDEVLARLRQLPDGERKAAETAQMIARLRAFAGYREHPKYGIVCRLMHYKRALLDDAASLQRDGVIDEVTDVFFLTFDELVDAVRSRHVDRDLVRRRRSEHRWHEALTPPRVLTSRGDMRDGAYERDDLPPNALPGIAVSSGVVEGRARVVRDLDRADLAPGDILVTAHTDPSWSPAFVSAGGLVTEVGGVTTHGAVIAREYGLPAVVGVDRATTRITDGQRIRVDGTRGHVELLGAPDAFWSI